MIAPDTPTFGKAAIKKQQQRKHECIYLFCCFIVKIICFYCHEEKFLDEVEEKSRTEKIVRTQVAVIVVPVANVACNRKVRKPRKKGNRNAFYVLVMLLGPDFNLGSVANPQINATCARFLLTQKKEKNKK